MGGLTLAAKRLRKQVPRDLSVIGFDDIRFARYLDPPLTTVSQPTALIGHEVVRLLLDILAGRTDVTRNVTLPHELVVRASTAAARQA